MKPIPFRKIRGFLLRFVIAYCLLLVPWPGLGETYGAWFRTLGRACFSWDGRQREIEFQKGDTHEAMTMTRIEIVNRDLMARDGTGPVRNLDVDTGGFWRSTALLLALVMVTPIPWSRRIRAAILGCTGVHAFILLSVAFAIWNDSRHIGLVSLTPFWEGTADSFQHALFSQLEIAVPALIWILATFRRQDMDTLIGSSARKENQSQG